MIKKRYSTGDIIEFFEKFYMTGFYFNVIIVNKIIDIAKKRNRTDDFVV